MDVIERSKSAVNLKTTYLWGGEHFVAVGHEGHGEDRALQCARFGQPLPIPNANGDLNENVIFDSLRWGVRMNEEGFLEKLKEIRNRFEWRVDSNTGEIRGLIKGEEGCFCPITAVTCILTDSYFDLSEVLSAAEEIHLDPEIAEDIIVSADKFIEANTCIEPEHKTSYQGLRTRLLEAIGNAGYDRPSKF